MGHNFLASPLNNIVSDPIYMKQQGRMQHGRAKKIRHQKKVGGKVFALDYGRLMGDSIYCRKKKPLRGGALTM